MTIDQSPERASLRHRLTGIIPPVVTPLNEDGSVDYTSLDKLVGTLLEAGVHGLFALGSTGETAYMTDRERVAIVEAIATAVDGRVPVLAGAIDLTAARVVERAVPLTEAGADAIVATAPIYAINDIGEVADHFRFIADRIGVPLLAYDIPARIHYKLPAELLVELGTDGVLAGCKDSSSDDGGFRRLIALNKVAGRPLRLLTGHEVLVDGMAMIGADGAVPGLANVDAAGYVRLWDAAQRGDWSAAQFEQERLNRLFEIVFVTRGRSRDAAGVGAFKAAMVAQGLIRTATMCQPVQTLAGPDVEHIAEIVRSLDFSPAR